MNLGRWGCLQVVGVWWKLGALQSDGALVDVWVQLPGPVCSGVYLHAEHRAGVVLPAMFRDYLADEVVEVFGQGDVSPVGAVYAGCPALPISYFHPGVWIAQSSHVAHLTDDIPMHQFRVVPLRTKVLECAAGRDKAVA